MRKKNMINMLVFCSLISANEAITAAPTYLPVTDVSAGLADGKTWNMAATDGKKGQILFNAGGTGQIQKPVKLKIKWVTKGNEFCMKMGFMLGTKCFQAVKTANGYQGFSNGKASITFTR